MKSNSLTLALLVALALYTIEAFAKGTTGHYDNSYAHGGYQGHAHEDHIYGYDSV